MKNNNKKMIYSFIIGFGVSIVTFNVSKLNSTGGMILFGIGMALSVYGLFSILKIKKSR